MNEQVSFTLRGRNPDVLTCIANLSNDEVFTPPELAGRMLDLLAEAWATDHGGANLWADKKDWSEKGGAGNVALHFINRGKRTRGFIKRSEIRKNPTALDTWKVLVPEAYGAGETFPHQILGKEIVASPPSACTQSYLVVSPFLSESDPTQIDRAKPVVAFFEAKGTGAAAEFKHKSDVQKWLDIIRGGYAAQSAELLKTGTRPPFPYSDVRLLPYLQHSFWYLPNVAACQAMANLLAERHNTFWLGYQVIMAAGSAAGIGLEALPPVRKAIGSGFDTKTITLSCGKLTTGVTVAQWSAILMLLNLKSPESYFQAAFRVQSPWSIKNPNGDNPNEEEILKPVCFVFDFAPTRALLVNVDNGTLRRILDSPEAMDAVGRIEGWRSLGDNVIETIINKSDKVKDLKTKAKDGELSDKEKKELSAEEKEYKSKRKLVQEKLIKFATRIPAFMYLTDFRENTLQDVITKLEPELFMTVTGLTVQDFHLLVRLKVFNTEQMNAAVFAFRRYEDASLRYTGVQSHDGLRHYGLYDTVVAKT